MGDRGAAAEGSALTPAEAMARAVEISLGGPEHGPNPRVGCVILDDAGGLVGEGFHRGAGTAHAEVAAIADAKARGNPTAGAVAYVTLEPCRHVGRTGPCVDALTEAGVARVVYAVEDPGEDSGGGAEVLTRAGHRGDARAERGGELAQRPLPARAHRGSPLRHPEVRVHARREGGRRRRFEHLDYG